MDKKKDIKICSYCKDLIGKGRHDPPHIHLIQTKFIEFPSQFGNVDEYYYKCKICSTFWLHEHGNYGQGWQIQKS
ncbi:hypothetical protein ACQ7CU_04840 [Chryseobacterium arthrosphaerae]|uniref:hypothetical protein n=1 Tax=Chryseobacterium arthrosphaerae TaxID=651561 RepID=UPI003D333E82